MSEHLIEQLEAALSPSVRRVLLAYTYKLVKERAWPGEGDLLKLAEDVMSEAICKVFSWERKWNPEVTPNPVDFFFSSVKSWVDSRCKNGRNKLSIESLEAPQLAIASATIGHPQRAVEAEEFFIGLMIELGDDEVCCRILDLYERGFKPDEVACELDLPTQEVYAANKRLKRKAAAYLQKLKENG